MTSYDIYVFILCLIVFIALTALFSFLISAIIKLTVRLVRSGAEDEKIKREYADAQKKKDRRLPIIIDRVVTILLCCVLFVFFGFSVYVNLADTCVSESIPTINVVKSGSMASKNPKNRYLFNNGLNNQFQTFDLILLYKMPAVEDLQLYDIVLYEIDGEPVVHRIVGIEPPSETHKDYYFLLQGDAIENPDRFPVYYEQMRGIYRGQHIPFLGSFVAFMQSVAGYLCILLTIFGIVAIPTVEKRVNAVKLERLAELGAITPAEAEAYAKRRGWCCKRRNKK